MNLVKNVEYHSHTLVDRVWKHHGGVVTSKSKPHVTVRAVSPMYAWSFEQCLNESIC